MDIHTQEAEEFVVRELGRHRSRNEITRALCERMGFNWLEAERFIKEVESQRGRSIAARQSPLFVILGVAALLAGIGLTIYSSMFFIDFFQPQQAALSVDRALKMSSAYYQGGYLLTGITLIISGIVGCWKTIAALFG